MNASAMLRKVNRLRFMTKALIKYSYRYINEIRKTRD
ncbi:hypothetical protein SAMN05444128_3476 [Pontibacter indicus]|uniref:Uncharacterized protein n=1 Tax=Pontibacter indicus TaxID=1317125 RepID=A0A1R3XQV3_9BACT|nr:hypothetical protein SAMN05444128_3476 [Pontibacter indicus]